jgi:hypothetical protein
MADMQPNACDMQESVPAFANFTAEDASGAPPKKAPKKEKPPPPPKEEAPAAPAPKADAPAAAAPKPSGEACLGALTCSRLSCCAVQPPVIRQSIRCQIRAPGECIAMRVHSGFTRRWPRGGQPLRAQTGG